MKRPWSDSPLCCSFCRKSQDVVGKLISSPSDYPRAYICDECITVCNSILEDDRQEGQPVTMRDHPLAPVLLDAVEQWMILERDGGDASEVLAKMRRIAARMMAEVSPPGLPDSSTP